MHHRDYFLKLTQQFAKMIAKLMGLKEAGEIEKASVVIDEAYKEFFGLDRKYIWQAENQSLLEHMKEKKLSFEHMELLAKLLYEDAQIHPDWEEKLLHKAMYILNYLNAEQKLYSFEREELIRQIQKRVKN